MAYKTNTFTSGEGGARLVVEQTGVNGDYGTLTAYVQISGSHADRYSAPTINFSDVDSSYVWSGSAGTLPGSGWQNVFTKTGIIVYYWSSYSTRSFTVRASGTYTYDATEEGGDVYTTSYNISGTFEMYPKSTPPPVVNPSISTSASSCTLGNSVNIVTANGSSASVTVKIGSTTVETISSVGAGTRSWTPALATYAPKITSGSSATATLTWNGASTSITLSVSNNSSTVPTCSATVAVVNGLSGLYVKGKSQAKVTVTASTKYSATVSSYTITIDGGTYSSNPATSSTLTNAGSRSYSAYIKDSRGFTSSTVSGSFTVTDYASPTLSGVSIYRSNSSGTSDTSGTYITFKFNPTISALSNNNTKKYYLQYKTESASSWTSAGSGTLSAYTGAQSFVSSSSISATTAYQARVGIEDYYGTVYSASVIIPTAAVIMDFNTGGTGGGLGMYTQNAGYFDADWAMIPHKGLRGIGASGSNVPTSGIYPVRLLRSADLGNPSGTDNFIKAWIKKVCEIYPSVSHGIFIGDAVPGSVMTLVCNIYSTSTLDASTGLPQYCAGISFGYYHGLGAIYTYKTTSYAFSGQFVSGGSSATTIYATKNPYAATTSYAYTGVSCAIPAGARFTVTAHAYWVSVAPAAVAISTSSSSLTYDAEGLVNSGNAHARTTWSGHTDSAATLYVWAKSQSSGNLGISIDGFYL